MAVKNFNFRKNWVGSEVASMKKAIFAIFGPIWTHILAPTGPNMGFFSILSDVFCQKSVIPSHNSCEGRIPFKCYNPNKPEKYGIKIFKVCDLSNAYCCVLDIYVG